MADGTVVLPTANDESRSNGSRHRPIGEARGPVLDDRGGPGARRSGGIDWNVVAEIIGLALKTGARMNVPLATGAAGRQIYAMARLQGRSRDDWTTGIFQSVQALAGPTG